MTTASLVKRMIVETLGSFGIVFLGCGALMTSERFVGSLPPGGGALAFGLAVIVCVNIAAQFAEPHLNPAATLAFCLLGRSEWREAGWYWTAQFLGALAATGLLFVLMPPGENYGGTIPMVPAANAVIWEAILTFFLISAVIAGKKDALLVGATLVITVWVGGPITGASMNPARSFAPCLMEHRLHEFWIYLIGPMIGAAIAACVSLLFTSRTAEQKTHSGDVPVSAQRYSS